MQPPLADRDRMPATRRALYACFVLLALLALLRFDLKLLIPITLVPLVQFRDSTPHTVFGTRRPPAPASQPRDTADPVVRVYLVVGGLMLLAGLAVFLPFAVDAARSPQPWMGSAWLALPGLHATLLGAVLTALGLDLLWGGLGRREEAPQELAPSATLASEGPGRLRLIAPWLALAWVADLGGWPNLAQAVVGLIGLGGLWHLAAHWPLFAALAAPAVAFFAWSATGHARNAFGPENPLVFVILIAALVVGLMLVASTLGRATTGLLDIMTRRTWAREPWLRQAALGVAAGVLAFSAHTHLQERRAQRLAAAAAARDADALAASRAAAEQAREAAYARAAAEDEADAQRAAADRTPGISCRFSFRHDSFVFKNQPAEAEPGTPGRADQDYVRKSIGPRDAWRQAQVLDAHADLAALRQQASTAPILRLPSGDVVFLSPADARLLILNPSGRVLQLARFEAPLPKSTPVACAGENGTRWAVALGPVVKVFERPAPEGLPFEVNQDVLKRAWFP